MGRYNVARTCQHCSKSFVGRAAVIYCSDHCADEARTAQNGPERPALRRPVSHCAHCGNAYADPSMKRYCSTTCRNQAKVSAIKSEMAARATRQAKVRDRAKSVPIVNRLKSSLADQGAVRCEACGWRAPTGLTGSGRVALIHIHHVVPLSCGGANNDENLLALCPNHHSIAHRLGSINQGKWFGAKSKMELLEEVRLLETDEGAWQRFKAKRLAIHTGRAAV